MDEMEKGTDSLEGGSNTTFQQVHQRQILYNKTPINYEFFQQVPVQNRATERLENDENSSVESTESHAEITCNQDEGKPELGFWKIPPCELDGRKSDPDSRFSFFEDMHARQQEDSANLDENRGEESHAKERYDL